MTTLTTYPQLVIKRNAKYAPMQAALSELEGSRNCTCAGSAGLANWWLGKVPGDAGFVTHHRIRLLAGDPRDSKGNPRGLGSGEALQALQALGVQAKRYYGESYLTARAALERGAAVGVCVHYPTINNYDGGKWSGQPTFKGEHFLVLKGWTADDPKLGGRNSTTDYDSLFDGRTRTWGTAPEGPQLAPFAMFRRAMGTFLVGPEGARVPIGTDKGVFIVVEAREPTETPEETIARLTAELKACKEANP
jgi:hypothetical protein